MKSKKLLTVVAAAAALTLVVSTGPSARAADATLKLELISKGFTHQFWQAVKKGAEDQAKAMNATINFVGPATETEIEKQLTMLDEAIAKKPDGIGYAALGTTQALSHLAAAKKAGIPVYQFDTAAGDPASPQVLGVNSDVALGVAYTNSKAAGKLAAQKLAAQLGKKGGQVFVIGHTQTNQTGIDRRDGFVAEIKKYKAIKLLPVQYAEGGDKQKAQDVVAAALIANPKLAGVYATNEGCSIGAANAFIAAKKKPGAIKLIGFDSGAQQIANIKSGIQTGAITQNPIGIGAETVKALVNYIRNKTVPKTVTDTGFYFYDKMNLTDPKIAADLYN